MIFFELLRHKRLEMKRNPMYEGSALAKFFLYLGIFLFAIYLIMFGSMFPFLFDEIFPGNEPYHIMGNWMVFIWLADFLMRLVYQKPPSANLKPYILLPIGKKKIVDGLMLGELLSYLNLFWLFFFVPFALFTVVPFYGWLGALGYILCAQISILINDLIYIMFRSLMALNYMYILIPLALYGGFIAILFIFDDLTSPVFITLGDLIASKGWLMVLPSLAVLFLVWSVARAFVLKVIGVEIASVEKPSKDNATEYSFFDRLGEIGTYMKLEMKQIMRNKNCKTAFITGIVCIIMFVVALFADIYSEGFGQVFVMTYNFSVLGIMLLSKTMSYEGNYIDSLLIRRFSLLAFLKAKYYLHCIFAFVPFLIMIPLIVAGNVTLFRCIALYLFTCGVTFVIVLQLVVYNKKTMPLNKTVVKGGMSTGIAELISLAALIVSPLFLEFCIVFLSDMATDILLSSLGLIGMLTSKYWLRNLYNRFNKRKYINLEGLRATR